MVESPADLTARRFALDPSLVSYRHGVGYRRSPGNWASHVTASIGECRMSLWSAVVVSIQAHGSGAWSTSCPQFRHVWSGGQTRFLDERPDTSLKTTDLVGWSVPADGADNRAAMVYRLLQERTEGQRQFRGRAFGEYENDLHDVLLHGRRPTHPDSVLTKLDSSDGVGMADVDTILSRLPAGYTKSILGDSFAAPSS